MLRKGVGFVVVSNEVTHPLERGDLSGEEVLTSSFAAPAAGGQENLSGITPASPARTAGSGESRSFAERSESGKSVAFV